MILVTRIGAYLQVLKWIASCMLPHAYNEGCRFPRVWCGLHALHEVLIHVHSVAYSDKFANLK